jgi:hypothetical protein
MIIHVRMAYNNNGMAACDESENQKESYSFYGTHSTM